MVYIPHARLSLIGDLPDGEMFSCNLSLAPQNQTTEQALEWLSSILGAPENISQNNWDDIVSDCTTFWSTPLAWISSRVILKRIKLAPIGANGLYTGPAREAAVNVAGGGGPSLGNADMLPHQMARKVTFETAGDLGRVKGGFYLPGVTETGWDRATDLIAAGTAAEIRDVVQTFLNNLNDAPGLDGTGSAEVVIASQGRTRNGVQVVPPTNWPVTAVNVGRRLDVQRRRANKLSEARISDAAVS